jgi:hypothetical protein
VLAHAAFFQRRLYVRVGFGKECLKAVEFSNRELRRILVRYGPETYGLREALCGCLYRGAVSSLRGTSICRLPMRAALMPRTSQRNGNGECRYAHPFFHEDLRNHAGGGTSSALFRDIGRRSTGGLQQLVEHLRLA